MAIEIWGGRPGLKKPPSPRLRIERRRIGSFLRERVPQMQVGVRCMAYWKRFRFPPPNYSRILSSAERCILFRARTGDVS